MRADPDADLPPPRGCTNLRLRRLTRRVGRDYDECMRRAVDGLTATQFSLLSAVAHLAPVRQADLAHTLSLEPSTLTRNLRPLLAQGYLRAEPGDDQREHRLTLTDAGRAKRDEARQAWLQAQRGLQARLGEQRVARLHALLDECQALLDDSQ